MKWLRLPMTWIFRARFRLLGLATITDIPTGTFRSIIEELRSEGWSVSGHYRGFDAWIDYGRVKLRKGRGILRFEWDNWTEGSIEGRRAQVEALARRFELPASRVWRGRE